MGDIKFSVIVPIYKVEKYLKKCIESILNQSYKNFELILVDDGSPDNCPHICDNFAKKDNRIMVIHKENEGLVAARNTGLKHATGEYICYVDGDDWINKSLLETVRNKAINKYNPDMVIYNAVRVFEDKTEDIPKGLDEGIYYKNELQEKVYPYMMYDNRKEFCTGLIFPVAWNKIYKSELIKKHFCKDTRIKMGEDNAFVFECLYYSESIYFCDDILYYYNQLNSGSMTNSYDEKRFDNNKILIDYMESNLKDKNEVLNNQLNAFKVYWLIMAIFHEIKCNRPFFKSIKHIKQSIKQNKTLNDISLNSIPFKAKIFVILLKLRLYSLTLLLSKIVNRKRSGKGV